MPFQFTKLKVPDVLLIEPRVFNDERGFFKEIFKSSDFAAHNIGPFLQVNHSKSSKNVLRGLHYQLAPKAQGKAVRVIQGEIFDVGVDIRKGSPSYGQWVGEILSAENSKMLFIPEGFAHGFCVLSETAEMVYYCTDEYAPESDRGILWNDPRINIDWPIDVPILSEKDSNLPLLQNAENNFEYSEK